MSEASLDQSKHEELVRLLLADIRALVPLIFPYRQAVSEAHIRFAAVVMRRWLIDGDLQRLLNPLRRSMMFNVQGTPQAQSYIENSGKISYYLAAGIKADGRPVSHIYEIPFPQTEVDQAFVREGRSNVDLKRFLSQPRLYHLGRWFRTAQIIRFVANKLGGNHLDFDREGEWALLDAANRYMCYGGPSIPELPAECSFYLHLEPNSDEVIGGVHLEITSPQWSATG